MVKESNMVDQKTFVKTTCEVVIMNKRLIFQVYIPIRGKSKLYDFCVDSVSKYCKKHDIDHIVMTEPRLRINPNMKRTNRNKVGLMKEAGYLPIFEKEWAFTYLDKYDSIAVIDADIYIRESAPNIFDELPSEYDWGGVLERDLPLTGSHRKKIQGYSKDMFSKAPCNGVDWEWKDNVAAFMNMGMMIFNQSIRNHVPEYKEPNQFIHRMEFEDFVDGVGLFRYSTDQVLLNYWLKECKARVKYMDWRWNALYRGVEDKMISKAHFIHFFLKDQIRPGKGEDLNVVKKVLSI